MNNGGPSGPPPNAMQTPFAVSVTFPKTVTIKLVNASVLGDYEFFYAVANFCCGAIMTLVVAYLQNTEPKWAVISMGAFFVIVSFISGIKAYRKRSEMLSDARTFELRTSEVRAIDPP